MHGFLGALAGSGIVVALVAFLARTWIGQRIQSSVQHVYNRQLEQFKSNLARELESFKADMSALLIERQVRLSKLHEQVMETVSGTYARMYRVQAAMEEYTAPFSPAGAPPKSEDEKRLAEALSDLKDHFQSRAIFLPEALYQEVFRFWWETHKKAVEYQMFVQQNIDPKQRTTRWRDVDKYVREESRRLLADIKESFRNLIEAKNLTELKALLLRPGNTSATPGGTSGGAISLAGPDGPG